MAPRQTLDVDAVAELLGAEAAEEIHAPIRYLAEVKGSPAVQDLARRAGLDLSCYVWPLQLRGPNRFQGLMHVVLPLVRSGLDTKENLDLLFGDARHVEQLHRELRMSVLLAPPEGSPAWLMGMRAPEPCDPDAPAPPAVLEALPRWQRPLRAGEGGGEGGGEAAACSICHAELADPVQALPGCSHLYHPDCIRTWLLRKSTCPICRTPVPDAAPRPPSTEELAQLAAIRRMQQMWLQVQQQQEASDGSEAEEEEQAPGPAAAAQGRGGRGGGRQQRQGSGRGRRGRRGSQRR